MQSATLAVLEKANLPPVQARAIAEGIEIELMAQKDTLATKLDIAELRRVLEVDIGNVRKEIEGVKSDVVRWVVMCILGQTAVLFAAASFVLNHWLK